jgi:hypothetical protein
MPIFNQITINQEHLARVMERRTERNIVNNNLGSIRSTCSPNLNLSFNQWVKYIRKQNSKRKNLTSHSIQHIFD